MDGSDYPCYYIPAAIGPNDTSLLPNIRLDETVSNPQLAQSETRYCWFENDGVL